MRTSSISIDAASHRKNSVLQNRIRTNDPDLLIEENTEMLSVLNDLGELEDLTALYGNMDDII